MKLLIALSALVLVTACGKKDDGPRTKIQFLTAHESSESYSLHLARGEERSYRAEPVESLDDLAQDFPVYLINDTIENMTEAAFLAEISNPNHNLYKCAGAEKLYYSQYSGQAGQYTYRGLECWKGEWY